MGWFSDRILGKGAQPSKLLWHKCQNCGYTVFRKHFEKNLKVCPSCNFHHKLTAYERIKLLLDEHSFTEQDKYITSSDPLEFSDLKSYSQRITDSNKKTGLLSAVVSGKGKIEGNDVYLAVFDFEYMGGSMGSAAGEKITRAIERACEESVPMIIVSMSGGARMQEGIFSLMQMAKTSAALARLASRRIPYISVLTNPTTGGVTASFAMLGDIIIAEPGSLIGFAGPRVIEQTVKQSLPEGFQKSEFLLEHGFIDLIVERKNLKSELAKIIKFFTDRD